MNGNCFMVHYMRNWHLKCAFIFKLTVNSLLLHWRKGSLEDVRISAYWMCMYSIYLQKKRYHELLNCTWTSLCPQHLLPSDMLDTPVFRGFMNIPRVPWWAQTKETSTPPPRSHTQTYTEKHTRAPKMPFTERAKQLMMIFIVIHVLIYSPMADVRQGCNMQMLVCYSMGIFRSAASSCH